MEFNLDGQKRHAFLAAVRQEGNGLGVSRQSQPVESVSILCHLPELGEWKEFQHDSFLSFFSRTKQERPN